MSDGSEWVDLVIGTIAEQRITALLQSRIKNALLAELLTGGMPPELKDNGKLIITFPKEFPAAVRIHLTNDANDAERNFLSDFIAKKTEQNATFLKMQESGAISTSSGVASYHRRCDTTISSKSFDNLLDAIGSMITNPIIKKQFLESDRGPQRQ